MTWEHVGGGCCLECEANFPCDDEYEETETSETLTSNPARVRFYTTMEAHPAMPRVVETLMELWNREGVMQPWEENTRTWETG